MFLFIIFFAKVITSEFSVNLNYLGPYGNNVYNEPSISATKNHVNHRRLASMDLMPKFYHGIASGDMDADSFVIWTRITPPFQDKLRNIISNDSLILQFYSTIIVKYVVSTSDNIDINNINTDTSVVKMGDIITDNTIDYTVKAKISGLPPNTKYYYKFAYIYNDTIISTDTGTSMTLAPAGTDITDVSFAFGSCKQYTHGYFNNLRDIGYRSDIDFMVWLGDYIYEFPNTDLVNGSDIGRIPHPNSFLYELDHYRSRYATHKIDEDNKLAHKTMPWIMVWDDHEVVNDYSKNQAPSRWQDDSLFNVEFPERRLNGYQAFFEWSPVNPKYNRTNVDIFGGFFGTYTYGNLLTILMIDGRSQRTFEKENLTYSRTFNYTDHYCLGQKQRDWLFTELEKAKDNSVWTIIGNNNPGFGYSPPADIFENVYFGEGLWFAFSYILKYISKHNLNQYIC